jgi:hypothetical protein
MAIPLLVRTTLRYLGFIDSPRAAPSELRPLEHSPRSSSQPRSHTETPAVQHEAQLVPSQETIHALRSELSRKREDLIREKNGRRRAEADVRVCAARISTLEEQLQDERDRASRASSQATRELNHLKQLLRDYSTHHDQLVRESSAAQQWLSVHDTVTDSQIIEAMDGLNYDLSNLATTLADILASHISPSYQLNPPDVYRSLLSPCGFLAMSSFDHSNDPTLPSIACSALLSQVCIELVERWKVDDQALHAQIHGLFQNINCGGM